MRGWRKVTLAELLNEPWIQLPADGLFGSMVVEIFRSHGLAPPQPTIVSHFEYLQDDLLTKGHFLMVVPGFMLKVPGWRPRLKALRVALPNTRLPIGLITLKNRMLTPLAQLFIENVRAIAKSMEQSA